MSIRSRSTGRSGKLTRLEEIVQAVFAVGARPFREKFPAALPVLARINSRL